MNKLRDDTRLMIGIVRILYHFKTQDPISFHIDKGIEGASSKMGAECSLETGIILRS
jgi:hypothetical protein